MKFLREGAKPNTIKLLILDVDGVLTNGKIYLHPDGSETKVFHVHDGLGMRNLMEQGIAIAAISGRSSPVVSKRLKDLGVEHIYQGASDKIPYFEKLLAHYNIKPNEVAYVGDDTVDLPVMQQVGLAITVVNATTPVKEMAHWQSEKKGGGGAVREICDELIKQQ